MISTWTQIDPIKRRYRFYQISMEPDLFADWRIRLEWGRINAKKRQQQIKIFENESTAMAFLEQQERKRARRGYLLVPG
ncbi:WGR domain-containing protein [Fluviicoccus keumensis]|uniref:WGR domain-containing protein n=1 Tax=Fluviicoccus keumensis TaxID=1435465 RepID=A0A4Q7YGX9_9GAMM|nr:WGR domain-containing protein [Fluviicoccus keumensis]RZU36752.1 WGR domain-containing protein [Fluviicoccus keumensis]